LTFDFRLAVLAMVSIANKCEQKVTAPTIAAI